MSAARYLLALRGKFAGLAGQQWNMDTSPWQAAEHQLMQSTDAMIQGEISSGKWVQEARSKQVATILSDEQTNEVSAQLGTECGVMQRRVIEWFVGELTLWAYTFTDRLK